MTQIQCPNCQQYKCMKFGSLFVIFGVFFSILVVPILFIPIGLIIIIAAPFSKGYTCTNCKCRFIDILSIKK